LGRCFFSRTQLLPVGPLPLCPSGSNFYTRAFGVSFYNLTVSCVKFRMVISTFGPLSSSSVCHASPSGGRPPPPSARGGSGRSSRRTQGTSRPSPPPPTSRSNPGAHGILPTPREGFPAGGRVPGEGFQGGGKGSFLLFHFPFPPFFAFAGQPNSSLGACQGHNPLSIVFPFGTCGAYTVSVGFF